MATDQTDYVDLNRRVWTQINTEFADAAALAGWHSDQISWGVFGVPETEVAILGDVSGLDVVELGCGTAYFSSWLARRGARPVGVDVTPAQLDTARRCMAETAIEFPLVEASAENVPLPDTSFDLAISEHGASTWCDPHLWIPEAARLLRPGGRLVFLHMSPLATICFPDVGDVSQQLQRPYFGLHRLHWGDDDGIEFQLTHTGWIDVMRAAGLDIERLIELQAPAGAPRHPYYGDWDPEWCRNWPGEEIWAACKPAKSSL